MDYAQVLLFAFICLFAIVFPLLKLIFLPPTKYMQHMLIKTSSLFLVIGLLLSLCSCGNPRISKKHEMFGPEEFVCESQMISGGGHATIKDMQGRLIAPLPEDALEEYEDVIAEDDVLEIVIYHPSRQDLVDSVQSINEQTKGFRVINGEVCLPCISSIPVAGLTLSEARQLLKDRFQEYIKDVDVFITYKHRYVNKVELAGLVKISHFPINGRVRLYEILAEAKLPPYANLYASYILRDGCQLNVDFYKLLNEGDMTQNIVMKPGDKIFIGSPEDKVVMVSGEIGFTRTIPVPYGAISLREALVLARGIPFTGDRNHIYVIRGGIENPRIYALSWDFMIHQPNEDSLLIPGDLVYVASTAITQWQRFFDQSRITDISFVLSRHHQIGLWPFGQ